MRNSRSVLNDVELNVGVRPLYKDLEVFNLSRCVFSANMKSVSEKCLLHK